MPCTAIYTGPLELPVVKEFPNVPTIVLFCLIPITFPLQPSPYESVMVMVKFNKVGSGHPPIGQKVEKMEDELNALPAFL